MRRILNEARDKLGALPRWLKVLMVVQTMLVGTLGFIGFGGVVAVQSQQLVLLTSAISSLPEGAEARSLLFRSIQLGASDGHMWNLQVFVGMMLSVVIGGLIVCLTPWKPGRFQSTD